MLFSVIIPVYNIRDYLHKCLKSILCQKFKDYEIVLVDDGSTDGSSSICDEYAQNDSRIYVIHKENGGVVSARNIGIKEIYLKNIIVLMKESISERITPLFLNVFLMLTVSLSVKIYYIITTSKIPILFLRNLTSTGLINDYVCFNMFRPVLPLTVL